MSENERNDTLILGGLLVATLALGSVLSPASLASDLASSEGPRFDAGKLFRRGDATNDGRVGLDDMVAILDFLFGNGAPPGCLKAADANDDGRVDLGDATFLAESLGQDEATLPAPFGECGFDPTEDSLSCVEYDCSAGARTELVRAELLGDVHYASDCSPGLRAFLEDVMVYGRIAAASEAFEECVREKLQTQYRECMGDPFFGAAVETQIQKVLAVARSVNDVKMFCSGGGGNASASLGTYGHDSRETFRWSEWLSNVYDQLDRPVCREGESPQEDGCRFAEYPWPYSQAAGIVWHEAMHTHGYTHGANEQDDAKVACGYAGDPTWHFQVNTMPYIIGDCITAVIDRSGDRCGNIDACGEENQLRIITGYNSSDCECVNDPGRKGLGILAVEDRELVDDAILPAGDWVGAWHYGSSNRIAATGDFNGNGRDDLVTTSSWGIGIVTHDGWRWRLLMAKPSGTRFGGWSYSSSATTIVGAGDFNGDGRDDLLVRSTWGIGVLTLSGGSLTSLLVQPHGSWFGGWHFDARRRSGTWRNEIEGVGDFSGNGRKEILITSDWGIGLLGLRGSTFDSVVAQPNGSWFGSWRFDSLRNTIAGLGDFNGDGRADVLVVSDWGIGILSRSGSTLTSAVFEPNGTWFGGWHFDSRHNTIAGIGDLNGDGRDDLVVVSDWGIGVLSQSGSTMSSLVAQPSGTWFGSWHFDARRNTVAGVGDFDGNRRDDLIVRSDWGSGLLRLRGSTLTTIDAVQNETLAASWLLEASDRIVGVANFNGRRGDEILVQAAP